MRYLPHLSIKDKYYSHIEQELNVLFYEIFYKPILEILKQYKFEIKNAKDPIQDALMSGRITYDKGVFKGKLSATISKKLKAQGGVYSKARNGWVLPVLPEELKQVTIALENKLKVIYTQINHIFANIPTNYIVSKFNTEAQYDKTLSIIDEDFNGSMKSIAVLPYFPEGAKEIIAKEYSDNLNLYIKKFTNEHIAEIRAKVEENAFNGLRASNLESFIMQSRNTTAAKAKFLARQETSLLLSKYSEARYKLAGVQYYKWSSSHDQRVRHDHKLLDGTIVSWDSPPVVDRKTGRRAHAGTDFNCRCVKIPLIY